MEIEGNLRKLKALSGEWGIRDDTGFLCFVAKYATPEENEEVATFIFNALKDYEKLTEAKELLEETLESVDADEQARGESWPDEGLDLDLGKRIREFLQAD